MRRHNSVSSQRGVFSRKSAILGVVSLLRLQRSANRLPFIAPEDLVQVAMHGSSTDMNNTLLRFGPASIDFRIEPYGWNALHFAIRRGSPQMVQVNFLLLQTSYF